MTRDADDPAGTARADVVPFGAAVRAWFAISLQTFGGPAGQIAVMQRDWSRNAAGSGSGGSCTRSATACCCPGRRPSSWRSTSAGCSTAARRPRGRGPVRAAGHVAMLGLSALYVGPRRHDRGRLAVRRARRGGRSRSSPRPWSGSAQALHHRAADRPVAVAAFLALAVFGVPFPVVIAAAGRSSAGAGRRRPGTHVGRRNRPRRTMARRR